MPIAPVIYITGINIGGLILFYYLLLHLLILVISFIKLLMITDKREKVYGKTKNLELC